MDFAAHWRNWLKPLAAVIYFILMMIAIPLCIVSLTTDVDGHIRAWFIGGVFVLMAVPISLWEIINHVINYTQPSLQKYIIRIIWMVPIYAMNAWFALRFKEAAIYLDTLRECYEAYVIYNFMAYLLSFLWTTHPQLALDLSRKEQQKHLIPFCLLRPWKMGSQMIDTCKHGVLQYTIIRPTTTIIALICELNHKYDEGDFNFKSAWSYIVIINNISQIWAMYCLILFYQATKDMLAPIKPIPKFLCVKFVVFFSFWQAVAIAAVAKLDLIPHSEFYGNDVQDISTAIQDFLICIEMFIAAIAHYISFSHKPFINPDAETGNCCHSFLSMWDVSDVKNDVVEHVNVIGSTMKKTVTGMTKSVSGQFRTRPSSSEKTPLLQSSSSATAEVDDREDAQDDPQVTKADVHHNGYQSQSDVLSSTSDWDVTSVTSVDQWRPHTQLSQSTTASMNNFLDTNSVQSHTIERSSDTDLGVNKHPSEADSESKRLNEAEAVKGKLGSDSDSVVFTDGGSKSGNVSEHKPLIDFESNDIKASDDVFVKDEVVHERKDSNEVDGPSDSVQVNTTEHEDDRHVTTDEGGNPQC